MPKVLIEDRGSIRVVTLNRPEVHNAVDGETAAALNRALQEFRDDDAVRVMIVTGAGEKSFCSGVDLKNSGQLRDNASFESSGPLGFSRLDPGKPTIAAVNGYSFAGGMELAAWCDFRIAAGNAEFGVLNRRWGIPLIDGGTQRIPAIVGIGNALYLISTGVRIDANRALQMGFVQEVVPEGTSLERALELAERIVDYPPASLVADRTAALESLGMALAAGLKREQELGFATVGLPEMTEGLRRYSERDRPEAPRG